VESVALVVVLVPTVVVGIGTPVKSTADDVVASLRIRVVVSTRLANVNLSRCGPRTVSVVDWQHPDCRPKPVSIRKPGLYFDASKLDSVRALGTDTSRFDGVDNGSVGNIGNGYTVGPQVRAAATILEKVDDVVRLDQILILKSWLQDQHTIFDECILVGVGGLLELTIAK